MTPTTLPTGNPILPGANEIIWSVASILLIVAVVLILNWLLNRWGGKPIRWPKRWRTLDEAPSAMRPGRE